jgi:hypothetical protein
MLRNFDNKSIKLITDMKNILLFVLMAFSISVFAQQEDLPKEMAKPNSEQNENGPIMTFESTKVDFGTIERGSDPWRIVKFTNTGNEPLIIKHAKGSCGCTVPQWPKEPIMPGESSEMKVRYDTKRLGKINKTVKITTNEGGDPHVLRVVGQINPKEEEESLPKKPASLGGSNDGGK